MIFHETRLPGVFEIQLEPKGDDRGFFARSWCQREFEQHGLNPVTVQCNVSFNEKKELCAACTIRPNLIRKRSWYDVLRERSTMWCWTCGLSPRRSKSGSVPF